MKTKDFTKFELARLKRTAQNVEGFLKQKNKLEAKKAKIDEELATINEQIELTDAPTVAMTGYHSSDIIKKVVTPTDQVTKDGVIIKKVTFEFIYPDTIIPPTEGDGIDNANFEDNKSENEDCGECDETPCEETNED